MKLIIVGGGITGLSAAWYAQNKFKNAHITLIEKEQRLGGWIQTSFEQGFLFEKGPRTFQASRSPHLLKLIEELNLPIISSDPAAKRRFILQKNKLKNVTSFLPKNLFYLLRECFIQPQNYSDESIYDFAKRRFNSTIAETLFDPLTLGIYAGDIKKLSVRSCFPIFYEWEQKYGSIVKGMLFRKKKKEKKGLFTIAEGMQSLVDTLSEKLTCQKKIGEKVESVEKGVVRTNIETYHADYVINALPPNLPKQSIWVVNVAYGKDVIRKKGFGYLVPSAEELSLMGVIFDSVIFPSQNQPGQTRLTAMVKGSEKKPLEKVLEALREHLLIHEKPVYTSAFLAENAIAQYHVGCGQKAEISVDACVQRGLSLAENLVM